MNELNTHLHTALQNMEQGMRQSLDRQDKAIQTMQQSIAQLQARQQQSEQALQDLSNLSATLQSLLTRLNNMFASK